MQAQTWDDVQTKQELADQDKLAHADGTRKHATARAGEHQGSQEQTAQWLRRIFSRSKGGLSCALSEREAARARALALTEMHAAASARDEMHAAASASEGERDVSRRVCPYLVLLVCTAPAIACALAADCLVDATQGYVLKGTQGCLTEKGTQGCLTEKTRSLSLTDHTRSSHSSVKQ
jgi:hypothetical protein